MENHNSIKKRLQEQLNVQIDYQRQLSDEEMQEVIDGIIIEESKITYLPLREKQKLSKELFFTVRKLDILQELIEDTEITEVMINGKDTIFIEKRGQIQVWEDGFEDKEKLEDVIQQIVAKCNRVVNESSPIVDARLENGSRVNIVLPPIALNGPIVTIRRFQDQPIGMEELIGMESVSEEAAAFLNKLVRSKYNIFISGGTGSGKTTFLNALSNYIPKDERIITIEDSAELQILEIPNMVRLETRNANVEDCKEITVRDLIKASLRMRPDRIIVGEVRGGEAIDMIQCLNTGHDGSLSTGHANSAKDMLFRLETMVLMGMDLPLHSVRRQIASGLDIIIHLGRLRDKSRKIIEIVEVVGYEDGEIQTQSLYGFVEKSIDKEGNIQGRLEKQNTLIHKSKLLAAGIEI